MVYNIAILRKNAAMTQRDLADRLKVTQGAISQWESGATKPTLAHLIALTHVLGCEFKDAINCVDDGREAL